MEFSVVVGSRGAFPGHEMGVDVACNHTWAGVLITTSGVQLSGGLLSLCSQCPALWEYKCRHRKKDYICTLPSPSYVPQTMVSGF